MPSRSASTAHVYPRNVFEMINAVQVSAVTMDGASLEVGITEAAVKWVTSALMITGVVET